MHGNICQKYIAHLKTICYFNNSFVYDRQKEGLYMTKVDIISGFLGAGKTTFIKQLISDVFPGEKIVLIENEFGEIGIDGGFLKEAGIEITEMNSGCICCTLVGDFSSSLKKVVEEYAPARIIIEPSGVGKLSDVAKAVEDVKESCGITLNSRITVADAKKVRIYSKNFGEFYNNQIEHADTIVLSRTQLIPEDRLLEAVHIIREKNPHAAIITTPWSELDGDVLKSALDHSHTATDLISSAKTPHQEHACCGHAHHHEHSHHHEHHHDHGPDCSCGCHHHKEGHHHADDVFTSWGMETARKYEKSFLEQWLHELSETETYGTILRAKGIVAGMDNDWMEFDLVPGEYEIRTCRPDYTGKLCIIGTNLNTNKLQEILGL